jgi:hypothetical protein
MQTQTCRDKSGSSVSCQAVLDINRSLPSKITATTRSLPPTATTNSLHQMFTSSNNNSPLTAHWPTKATTRGPTVPFSSLVVVVVVFVPYWACCLATYTELASSSCRDSLDMSLCAESPFSMISTSNFLNCAECAIESFALVCSLSLITAVSSFHISRISPLNVAIVISAGCNSSLASINILIYLSFS